MRIMYQVEYQYPGENRIKKVSVEGEIFVFDPSGLVVFEKSCPYKRLDAFPAAVIKRITWVADV